MTSERTNQFKILLSDEEKAWLEEIAAARGLTSSDVLRQYVREAHAELEIKAGRFLGRRPEPADDFNWQDWHRHILMEFDGFKEPITREDAARKITGYGLRFGLGRALNELTRNGYLRHLKTGYVITPKGKGRAT
ncbi:MAG TPA: CopG family transcriptional regulator [Polyangiaceae bacterium]|jgi:hypothetical protein